MAPGRPMVRWSFRSPVMIVVNSENSGRLICSLEKIGLGFEDALRIE